MYLFAMEEDESPQALYIRLDDLVVGLKGFSCEWVSGAFVVEKFLHSIMPTQASMVFHVQQRPDYKDLTPNDVHAMFVTHENIARIVEKMRANVQSSKKKLNLALKANVVQAQESSEEEEESQEKDHTKLFEQGMNWMALLA